MSMAVNYTTLGAFKSSVIDWAIGHTALCALFLGGSYFHRPFLVSLSGIGFMLWAPLIAWTGWRATHKVWRGETEQELHGALIGMIFVLFVGSLIYGYAVYGRHGPI